MTALAWALVLVACLALDINDFRQTAAVVILLMCTIMEFFKHE